MDPETLREWAEAIASVLGIFKTLYGWLKPFLTRKRNRDAK